MSVKKRLLLYIIPVFTLNYLSIFIFWMTGSKWTGVPGTIMAVAYMFVPMIVALTLYRFVLKEPIRENLGISFKWNRWFFAAWFIMPAAVLACTGITMLIPSVTFTPDMQGMYERFASLATPEQMEQIKQQAEAMPVHPFWIGLLQGLIAGITINAVAGFGEELGWRGYMFRELKSMGFWKASLITGSIWGIWHAPVILMGHNYPSYPVAGVFLMTAWCILLGPWFHYIRIKSKSVIASAIMHGALNGTIGLSIMIFRADNDLLYGLTGLPGFITLILFNLILYFIVKYDRSLKEAL